ncbi:MAG: signal recognition particle protein [Syntrophotalea acetylenica]|jgi:signal recognition particle subunit SRP54|uniref:signal recognition particle protein n=1 Tax=Syntrophotalea acetylenica TaxID=29542 RepID=UPI002A36D169|nr:signal recognition particle protein [Syntrophotalea acetylenica]MDD4457239.1 signal recognition particle protein [Syntrophotalea acetylenica]MDY0262646.1 signal recognition particle protein [Syntrophotalea acetylenica]
MFDNLTDKLDSVFKKLRGQGRLTEDNIQQSLREVRLVLLEADVNFRVVKDFVANVRERAVGQEVLKSLNPAQQVIKIVRDELGRLMGEGQDNHLDLAARPPVPVMLCGLQGAGKTTSCAKLALKLRREKRNPLLVPADIYRPAAIDQLKTLGKQLDIAVFDSRADVDPVKLCTDARQFAELNGYDTLILDTAGRLHVDQELMAELQRIKQALQPREILLVADAMTGQDAVNVAESFDQQLDITGVILTKLDGDARGGAALSIRAVTGKPIKLVGLGEKLDALETFHGDRMAQRILGMGDVLSLIEKAQAAVDKDEAQAMEQKLRKEGFTLETFRDQLKTIKKMGSMESLLKLIPGAGKAMKQVGDMQLPDRELKKIEAIINSMTAAERRDQRILNGSRRLRIARGSGTTVQDVNLLVKRFTEAQKMMKKLQKLGPKGMKGMMGRGGLPM